LRAAQQRARAEAAAAAAERRSWRLEHTFQAGLRFYEKRLFYNRLVHLAGPGLSRDKFKTSVRYPFRPDLLELAFCLLLPQIHQISREKRFCNPALLSPLLCDRPAGTGGDF
jgi:hypothetical protein